MSDIQIDDILVVAIQTDSRHPNLPSDIQIGGQIWMSDIFKFGCHAPKLFYDAIIKFWDGRGCVTVRFCKFFCHVLKRAERCRKNTMHEHDKQECA